MPPPGVAFVTVTANGPPESTSEAATCATSRCSPRYAVGRGERDRALHLPGLADVGQHRLAAVGDAERLAVERPQAQQERANFPAQQVRSETGLGAAKAHGVPMPSAAATRAHSSSASATDTRGVVSPPRPPKTLAKIDREQTAFFKKAFGKKDAPASEFDLVINFDHLGDPRLAADVVARCFRKKFSIESD